MRALEPIRAALLVLALSWASTSAYALAVPELKARVNDYAGVLTPERERVIENQLAAYEQRTGQQFALLTVKSLEGDSIEDFGIRVAEAWQLGDKKRDDGLVLIVVPAERKLRIEVGYGLEGNVPDAVAARVIREIIAPAFQRGEYGLGIELAFDALMQAASGEAPRGVGETSADDERALSEQPRGRPARSLLNLIPFVLMIIFLFSFGGGRGGGGGLLIGSMLGGMGRMGGGGFSGGGGGGGGFRGGGGGGFGGGGASGGW